MKEPAKKAEEAPAKESGKTAEEAPAEDSGKKEEEAPAEEPAITEEEAPGENSGQESPGNGSGISPEFKAAMDSYEAFFDEYIAFMQKYSNSDDPAGMLMDYSNYMLKYADAMEKLNQMDTEEMTIEEQAYYIEVMARIQKKLLESSQ